MNQLSRRYLLKAAAACSSIGSLGLSAPAIGQGLTKVTFTTSWIPEGPNLFAYVARDKGFWKKNGLDVSVARGSGSGTAAQAVGAGTFKTLAAALGAAGLVETKSNTVRLESVEVFEHGANSATYEG